MAEKPKSSSGDGKHVKAPDFFERAKEEFEAILHHHHKETHGVRDDIDANTSMSDVNAPNVFERAKEEIEAIAEAIHHSRKESKTTSSPAGNTETWNNCATKSEISKGHSEKSFKGGIDKEEVKSVKKKPHNHHHRRETHGRSDDIDENTDIGEVKGPNVFERAKEEIEALVESIHPHNHKKD